MKNFKCRECGKPCARDGKLCQSCFIKANKQIFASARPVRPAPPAKQLAERIKANNNKGKCFDCGSPCGTYAKRCKECAANARRGKPAPPKKFVAAPTAPPRPTFSEWLKRRDPMLYGMLVRLGRTEPERQQRALKGILANIRAQKLNAQKSGLTFRVDTDPIREILTDAANGKFYCEEESGHREPESLYRYEIYYTV